MNAVRVVVGRGPAHARYCAATLSYPDATSAFRSLPAFESDAGEGRVVCVVSILNAESNESRRSVALVPLVLCLA